MTQQIINAIVIILEFFDCEDGPRFGCLFDSNYFECDDGTCVCNAARCDGNKDCSDGSDEGSSTCGKYLIN